MFVYQRVKPSGDITPIAVVKPTDSWNCTSTVALSKCQFASKVKRCQSYFVWSLSTKYHIKSNVWILWRYMELLWSYYIGIVR
jgi:hypothetical protein